MRKFSPLNALRSAFEGWQLQELGVLQQTILHFWAHEASDLHHAIGTALSDCLEANRYYLTV